MHSRKLDSGLGFLPDLAMLKICMLLAKRSAVTIIQCLSVVSKIIHRDTTQRANWFNLKPSRDLFTSIIDIHI